MFLRAPTWFGHSVSGSSRFFSFYRASRPLAQRPSTTDRGFPPVPGSARARLRSHFHLRLDRRLWPLRRLLGPIVALTSSGSENSSDVVAPIVVPIAYELLDPDFVSCGELLLLWLLLLLCCESSPTDCVN